MSFLKTLLASVLGFFIAVSLFFFFGFALIMAIVSTASEPQYPTVSDNSVLKIEPKGAIAEYQGADGISALTGGTGDLTMRNYIARIKGAAADSRIKGIWLKLGNYAGGWAQAEELRDALIEFKKSRKFIYASSDVNGYNEVNYYIATAADSIVINAAADMEINGIFAALPFVRPMLERLGVEAQVVRAGSFKSAVEPFIMDSASAENREMTREIVEGTFAKFRTAVTERRKIAPEQLQAVLDTQSLLTAAQAHSLGLVDAAMYDDQFQTMLKRGGKEPNLVELDEYIPDTGNEELGGDQIAIVYAVGQITRGASRYNPNPLFGGEGVGSETFVEAMRTARDNASIKAVVLRIDSPGGDAGASEEMWREVVLTREKKPVIVSMAGTAASGGYFIAAPADTIVAEPSTITGSIGVFGLWFSLEKLYQEKIGINMQVIETNPNADMFSSARSVTEQERGIIARQVDSTYQTFLRIVASGRGLSVDSVHQIAQGRVWTGEQAKRIGLVDELGGLDLAMRIAAQRVGLKEGGYSVRVLPRKKDFFETLAETFGEEVSSLLASRSPLDDYKALIDAVEARGGIQARMVDLELR